MTKNAKALAYVAAILAATALPALAHGPTPQKVDETIEIAAPPEKVWATVKDFANVGQWHTGLAKSSGDTGCASGTSRTLTFKTGGDLVEGADECDDSAMSLSYRSSKENIAALPASSYSAKIEIKPSESGKGSTVLWISRLYRADTTNEPAEDKNDAAAVKAMTDFIKTGLIGLKEKCEKP